jgi:spore coat polysaccharide biosynthesis protein SpsF
MTAAFIYARLSSKRLPKKALLTLGFNTLIETVIDNTKNDRLYKTILLTSDEKEDDDLEEIGQKKGIFVFRGSLNNVALRTLNCIKKFDVTDFLRINGDSPLIDNIFYEKCLSEFYSSGSDIFHNLEPRTYPYGYSVEIINSTIFNNSYKDFIDDDFEHITQFFYRNKDSFKISSIQNNLNFSDLQFTIDDELSYKKLASLFLKYPNINKYSLKEKIKIYNNE